MANFKSTNPWYLLKVWNIGVIIWHQIIINFMVHVFLWNLVSHDDSVGNFRDDSFCHHIEVLIILFFVMSGIPLMLSAVLACFNDENRILRVTVHI